MRNHHLLPRTVGVATEPVDVRQGRQELIADGAARRLVGIELVHHLLELCHPADFAEQEGEALGQLHHRAHLSEDQVGHLLQLVLHGEHAAAQIAHHLRVRAARADRHEEPQHPLENLRQPRLEEVLGNLVLEVGVVPLPFDLLCAAAFFELRRKTQRERLHLRTPSNALVAIWFSLSPPPKKPMDSAQSLTRAWTLTYLAFRSDASRWMR